MAKLLRTRILWVSLLIGGAVLLSGCYTQLAKPEGTKVVREYEGEPYYSEADTEYVEEEYVEEEAYTDSREVHVYHHVPYYGYYGTPWWFDPFYDPFFYDYYGPYSSFVSIHVGYYDPFYFSYFYYPYSYRYRPYYYGFDCYRPVRGYFVLYYPGQYVNVNTVPFQQRGFSRRGTQTTDDLGYHPNRVSVGNSSGGAVASNPVNSSGSGTQSDRRRTRRAPANPGRIENTEKPTSSPSSNVNDTRRTPKSVGPQSSPQPESKPNTNSNSGDSSRRSPRRESKQNISESYRPVNREVSKPTSQSNVISKSKGRVIRTRTTKSSPKSESVKSSEPVAPKSSPSTNSYSSSSRSSSQPSSSIRSSNGGGGGSKSSASSGGSKSSSSGRRARR